MSIKSLIWYYRSSDEWRHLAAPALSLNYGGKVPGPLPFRKGLSVEYLRLGVHIWVSVLLMGTLWRLVQYHLIASQNTSWQHVGRAMALQY